MKKNLFISLAILFAVSAVSIVSAQQTLPVSGGYYLIKNQGLSDIYIGGTGTGGNSVRIENASSNTLYHYFLITGNNTDGWTMQQVQTSRYITHDNSYTGSYADAMSTNRQLFKFDNTTNNSYIMILKKQDDSGGFANGIGSDNTGNNDYVYMNKDATANNKWLFVPMNVDLQSAIDKATVLYADGSGNEAANLQSAITTAQTHLTPNMTSGLQAALNELSAAVTALNTAMEAYRTANPWTASGLTFGTYHHTTDFEGLSDFPGGWSKTLMTAEANGNASVNDKIVISGSGSGNRGVTVNFPSSGGAGIVYSEFELTIGTPNINATNAQFYVLQDDGTVGLNRILNLYLAGTDGKFHLQNINNATEVLTGNGTTTGSYGFTSTNIAATATSVSWANNTSYTIKLLLDFSAHKILKMTIDGVVVGENLDFLSASANNISKLLVIAYRNGSSNTANISSSIDNFEIGELVPTNSVISGDADLQTFDETENTKTYTLSQYQPALGIDVLFPVSDAVWSISDYNGVSTDLVSITKDASDPAQAVLKTTGAVAADVIITLSAAIDQESATKSVTLKAVDLSALKAGLLSEINAASGLDDNIADSNGYLTGIVTALSTAISTAQGVYDNANATVLQINNAIIALQTAENTFNAALATYNDFVKLISTAQAAHDAETGLGTDAIKATLQSAIDAATTARSTIADATALENAVTALQAAIDAFNAAPRTILIADFEGNGLFNSYSVDWADNMTSSIVENSSSSCLNPSENSLHIKSTSSDKWYERALLKNSSNTPVSVTSENKYLHILIYSTGNTKAVFRYKDTSGRSFDDIGDTGNNAYDVTASWTDLVIDLSAVNTSSGSSAGLTSLYGIYLAGHWDFDGSGFEYYIDEIVLNNDNNPRVCKPFIVSSPKTSSEYLAGLYDDIIFKDGGQLTIDQSNAAGGGLKPYGVVQVLKTFEKDKWYAVGFPFDIAAVHCNATGFNNYDLETYKSGESPSNRGDYWLRTYDGSSDTFNDYTYGAKTLAAGGYVLQVPEALNDAEFTFTSSTGVTLGNFSDFATETGQYVLTSNPSVANLSITPASPFNYYCYEYTKTGNFGRLPDGATHSLKPFESLVVAKNIQGTLRSSLEVEQAQNPTGAIIPKNEQAIAIQYYNLQGIAVSQPLKGNIYVVKKIYKNQATEFTKIIPE